MISPPRQTSRSEFRPTLRPRPPMCRMALLVTGEKGRWPRRKLRKKRAAKTRVVPRVAAGYRPAQADATKTPPSAPGRHRSEKEKRKAEKERGRSTHRAGERRRASPSMSPRGVSPCSRRPSRQSKGVWGKRGLNASPPSSHDGKRGARAALPSRSPTHLSKEGFNVRSDRPRSALQSPEPQAPVGAAPTAGIAPVVPPTVLQEKNSDREVRRQDAALGVRVQGCVILPRRPQGGGHLVRSCRSRRRAAWKARRSFG